MFSLKEISDDAFVYRCHECGWESEIMTKQQAIYYDRSHKCDRKPSLATQNPATASDDNNMRRTA